MSLRVILLTCLLFLIVSCKETALDEYYNQDTNFSGNIYDAIDLTGVNNYFIQGVDSTDFSKQLQNTLVTVIAPSDAAFENYMAKYSYNSFEEIPKATLEDLIGQHVISWPHSPSSIQLDPYYFKRQSNMAQRSITKFDMILQFDKTIVSEAKYVQFYFPEMLELYNGTLDDYELLAGNSLSPTTEFCINDGIQVDSIIPYGNGWVYYVDEVVEPMQNLDDWLSNEEDYSLFNMLFNRYNLYYRDNVVSPTVDVKRSNLFQNNRYYRIDMELCFETVGYISSGDSYISAKGASGFTVVAPQNTVLENFIDTYFADYPGFKDSLNIVSSSSIDGLHIHNIVRALISPYMFVDQLIYPSVFASAEGINSLDGTNFKFADTDFSDLQFCSNGYAYGINKFILPRTFESILKPVYTSSEYKYFAAAVQQSGILGYLNATDANYTLMLPTDSAFIKNDIMLLDVPTYIDEYGGTIINTDGLVESVFLDVSTNPARLIQVEEIFQQVLSHLFTEAVTLTDQKQFVQNSTGDYVGITMDSIWSGGNMEAKWSLNTVTTPDIVELISGTDNGQVMVVNDLVKSPTFTLGTMISTNPEYSRFKDICINAGLLSGTILSVYANYPSVFIPTNDAIDQFILDGNMPVNEKDLQDFVKYFFVNAVAFTSESYNETLETLCKDEEESSEFDVVYKMVDLEGSPGALKVKGENNSTFLDVIEVGNSNIICTDGIIHQIEGVLN